MNRICTKCGIEKDLLLCYSKYSRNPQGKCTACKVCCKKQRAIWYAANKEEINASLDKKKNRIWQQEYRKNNKILHRSADLYRMYGITHEDYLTILKQQNGVCAICSNFKAHPVYEYKNMHVDHNKNTGRVRGILCHNCNTGFGLFKEDASYFKRAVEYLEKNNEDTL